MMNESQVKRRSKRVGNTWFINQREAVMVRSKPRVKREKVEETTEEFVARVNQQDGKRNGLKKQVKGARR